MIGFLSGNVIKIREKKLILDVGGVGYEIFANRKLLTKIQPTDSLKFWIHTHQTSDAISLFGFAEEKDLKFFELLNSVNGVGPKSALEILENPTNSLEKTIVSGDTKKLAETPGIGKKTAARIILELRSKIVGGDPKIPETAEIDSEILEAVAQLGYPKKVAEKILAKLPQEITITEEIVRWFLQNV